VAVKIAVEEDGLETATRSPGTRRGSLGGCDPVHPPSPESDEAHEGTSEHGVLSSHTSACQAEDAVQDSGDMSLLDDDIAYDQTFYTRHDRCYE
jgi:hypothetical protein